MEEDPGFSFEDFSMEMEDFEVKQVKQFDRVWKVGPGGSICSIPLVHAGTVYFSCCNFIVYAVNAATGDLRWKFRTMGSIVHSSPIFWEGMIFVGSSDHNVYALDAGTGELIWKFRTEGGVAVTPCIDSGMIYFGSKDQLIYCLDARTGGFIWKYKTNDQIVAVPTVHDGRLFMGSFDRYMYCLDAGTGRLIWRFETQGEVHNLGPVLVKDGVVYFAAFDNNLYALDEESGRQIWKFKTGNYGNSSTPFIHKGFIYHVSRDGILFKLTLDGKLVWKYSKKEMLCIPELYEERVYVGCEDHYLYCVDLDGKELWRFETQGAIWLKCVAFDGKICVPSWDCHLYVVDTRTHELVWKFRTEGSPSYLPPPYESFEIEMKIPRSEVAEEVKKKQYDLDLAEEEGGTSAYKSRITYQISTQYSEKGKYQIDSDEEAL
jgi:outer membrane protein assembly factor BamB